MSLNELLIIFLFSMLVLGGTDVLNLAKKIKLDWNNEESHNRVMMSSVKKNLNSKQKLKSCNYIILFHKLSALSYFK